MSKDLEEICMGSKDRKYKFRDIKNEKIAYDKKLRNRQLNKVQGGQGESSPRIEQSNSSPPEGWG